MSVRGQSVRVLNADQMPDDNAELAYVEIDFPRLANDTPASCPVPLTDLLRYLGDEAPGGEALAADDLSFLRTAQVEDTRYWIWRFNEPGGSDAAYATVSDGPKGATLGYGDDFYGLTPEQFMLGDYHQVF